jgi:tetratricopeptide (TPR) repeat protein
LQLSEAYEKGAVLAFYFADQLKGFEDSGFDIAGSMREFVLSLDATKEANRLAQFADARRRASAAREERRKNGGSQEIIIENPVTKRLLEIDQLTKAKNYTESEKQLKSLLETNPSESRIYYAMGRVASLSAENITDTEARKRRLLEAKNAYENVIRSATPKTDPALISLAYVALARIYEFYGETAYAIKIYEAAMKVGDVPDGAYGEAKAAREKLIKEQ